MYTSFSVHYISNTIMLLFFKSIHFVEIEPIVMMYNIEVTAALCEERSMIMVVEGWFELFKSISELMSILGVVPVSCVTNVRRFLGEV